MPQRKINELSSQKPIYKGFLVLFAVAGCCLMAWLPVNGQEILPADPLISVDADENHFNTVLTQIEKQIPYRFAFNTDLITKQKNITLHVKNLKLSDVLSLLLQGTNLKYSIIENQIVLELRPPSLFRERQIVVVIHADT